MNGSYSFRNGAPIELAGDPVFAIFVDCAREQSRHYRLDITVTDAAPTRGYLGERRILMRVSRDDFSREVEFDRLLFDPRAPLSIVTAIDRMAKELRDEMARAESERQGMGQKLPL